MSYVRWIYVLYLWGNVLTIEKQCNCFLKGSFFHSLPAINNRATRKRNKICSCYFISPLFLKFLLLILVVYLLLVTKKVTPRLRLSNFHSKVTVIFPNQDYAETSFQCPKLICYLQEKFNKNSKFHLKMKKPHRNSLNWPCNFVLAVTCFK